MTQELRVYSKDKNLKTFVSRDCKGLLVSYYSIKNNRDLYRKIQRGNEEDGVLNSIHKYTEDVYLKEFVSDGETFFRTCDKNGSIHTGPFMMINTVTDKDGTTRLLNMTCDSGLSVF